MFNDNTYTNLKTAYEHMLILRWSHARELFFQWPQEGLNCESLAYDVVT